MYGIPTAITKSQEGESESLGCRHGTGIKLLRHNACTCENSFLTMLGWLDLCPGELHGHGDAGRCWPKHKLELRNLNNHNIP